MKGPKSLEILGLLADLAVEGGTLAASALAKICFENYGGSGRAYALVLKRLEQKGLISLETDGSPDPASWVPRLTATGKLNSGTQNPREAWESDWNGRWSLLTFGLPARDERSRSRLRVWLQKLKFGKLQGSVWLSHRRLSEIEDSFANLSLSPDKAVCMEGSFWQSGNDDAYVEKAWELDKMQEAYSDYLEFADSQSESSRSLENYQAWKRSEKLLWEKARSLDPLLPSCLWPKARKGRNLALEANDRRHASMRAWQDAAQDWV